MQAFGFDLRPDRVGVAFPVGQHLRHPAGRQPLAASATSVASSWANCSGARAWAWANTFTRDSDSSPEANAFLVSGMFSNASATAT